VSDDLHRLVVIARGRRLIADVEEADGPPLGQSASAAALRLTNRAFRYNLDPSPFGRHPVAEARHSGQSPP
jgi:hypothetical protein